MSDEKWYVPAYRPYVKMAQSEFFDRMQPFPVSDMNTLPHIELAKKILVLITETRIQCNVVSESTAARFVAGMIEDIETLCKKEIGDGL
jgi:hypothetical protein